jgi:hypothetical protein
MPGHASPEGERRERHELGIALHPYLGYVYTPDASEKFPDHDVNDFGFVDGSPVQRRGDGKVIVGITGGSVALGLPADMLSDELSKSPRFRAKQVVIVRLAAGGYKQPQHLMALNYILALGGQFDVVLNIDGFNEVALPEHDNTSRGVYPFFPRKWNLLAQDFGNLEFQRRVGKIVFLRSLRQRWAAGFMARPARYSPTLQLSWKVGDHFLGLAILRAVDALDVDTKQKPRFHVTGPGVTSFTTENLYRELAAMWQRTSIHMDLICRAHGIKYLHFLQPNQYVEGSKPMGEAERRTALNATSPYRHGVKRGYPELVALIPGLQASGVNFSDLRMLFSDVTDALYIDDCCHFNDAGYRLLTRKIARAIIRAYDRDSRR